MRIQLIVFTGVLFLFFTTMSNAQITNRKIETSALGGWLFAGSNSGAKIVNAPLYSVSAGYIANPQVMYELNINSSFSKIRYDAYQGHSDTAVHYSQTYITFGVVRSFKTEVPKLLPYISTCIGIFNSTIQSTRAPVSKTTLAACFMGGLKVDLNERMGLKFQARIQAPLNGLGLGVGIGVGGPSVGIGSYSSTIQFDTSAGIFFRL